VERQALVDASVQPGGRAPAPGRLALVQAFVNTVDREHGPDLLAAPEGLAAWLAHRGLAGDGPPPGARDLREAVALREALRALLWANAGHAAAGAQGAGAAVQRAARRGGVGLRVGDDGAARLAPARGGVAGALGEVAAAAGEAMLLGGWARLKACPGERCGWAFHDASPNRTATWCSMDVCGGRAKARAYYRRSRSSRGPRAL
jgi:predicted RNA-binding Zn ribbon-like protein